MNYKKIFSIAFTLIFMAGCSEGLVTLPDDPNNEPGFVEQPSSEPERQGPDELPEVIPPVIPPVVEAPEVPQVPEIPEVIVKEPTTREKILAQYDYVDPNRIIPTAALEKTLIYFHENKSKFSNKTVVSLIDYSQKSTQKRWYFINMSTGVVWNIHVSHGKGSDSNHDGYAEKFSNESGSNATSLGYFKTAETYSGSNGYSLRLDGLSTTNSRARPRAIVVHGASYVQDANAIQGRSWGCPAVSQANTRKVIDWIKGGSLIYSFN